MENNKRIFEALRKIEQAIDEVRDLFPAIKNEKINILVKKHENPMIILKRVSGIITKYNESNAERKLDSLLKFLGIIAQKKK
jgi:hypothetical protein